MSNNQLLLDLIQEKEYEKIQREVKELTELTHKMRKSQYAKIGELRKLYDETRHELQTLKQAICKS